MKLTAILLLLACLQVSANGFSQGITLSEKNISLQKVFKQIHKQTGYQFFYEDEMLNKAGRINIKVKDMPLEKVLAICFKDLPLSYSIVNNVITVKQKTGNPVQTIEAPAFINIKGTVKDEKGNPLSGVSIIIKGTNKGTSTNEEGSFTIDANAGDVLVFTFVGYKNKNVTVGSSNKLSVVMEIEATVGSEIVVVGYGTQKAANVTGAISTVKMDNVLGNRPVSTLSALLQNVVPGLNVTINSGQPGAATTLNVRGATDLNTSGNTINAGSPLILLDNVPFNGGLNMIDPNDIATITVLKDAGSAAIYGGRSAYGVILITTKQGKKNQKPQFTYSNNITFASATNLPVKASPKQFLQSLVDIGTNTYWPGQNVATWVNLYDSIKDPVRQFPPYGVAYIGSKAYPLVGTNLITNLLGSSAPQIQNNFSVSGGNDKTTYRLAFGNTNENGVIVPSAHQDYYKRYNLSSALSSDVNKWLTTQINVNYYNELISTPHFNKFGDAVDISQLAPIADSITTINGVKGIAGTPKNTVSEGFPDVTKNGDVRLTGRAILKPLKGLTITGEYTYDNLQANITNYQMTPSGLVSISGFVFVPVLQDLYTLKNQSTIYKSLNVYANYEKSFGYHNLTFMAGYNQEENVTSGSYVQRSGMILPNQPSISNATGPLIAKDNYSAYALRGYFGRITYNYKGKYLAQVNSRYDGSSNFPPGHQFGFFPSGSLGWRISDEGFMRGLKPVLSDLKLRASYGNVGNQNISPYAFIPTISSVQPSWLNDGIYVTSLTPPGLISSNFTWEKVETLDYGIDFGLFSEHLTGSFDWYRRNTKDILARGATPLPAVLGTGAPLENTASLRSNGYEIQLNYGDHVGRNIRYHIGVNLSNNTSVVTKFDGNPTKLLSSYYAGQKVGSIWGYTTAGIYAVNDFVPGSLSPGLTGGTLLPKISKFQGQNPNPGDIMFKDYDGNGIVNPGKSTADSSGDQRIIGNGSPQYVFGISGSISYKSFTFSFVMSGVGKEDAAMANTLIFPNYSAFGTIFANELNYWTPTHTNAYFGRLYDKAGGNQRFNQQTQTRYLKNWAYLRINNLTLDYALPVNLLKKAHITSFHIFCSVEDPFMFDHLPAGIEPGLLNQGEGLQYPYLMKTSFGVNLTF